MNLRTLKTLLQDNPDRMVTFVLPDGDPIPPHFHVTEVGHVAKDFIDCGGAARHLASAQLQVWLGNDAGHRLTAGKLGRILALAKAVIPSDDLEVEIEYEACSISQYPAATADLKEGELRIQLAEKHTDCLAKEACGIGDGSCCN